jgi:thioredoxin reductase (NADPH)
MPTRQAAIIGAGPAGLAAAIQLKRSGIEAWLFEGGRMGGLLWNANLVENYPGFAGGIPGPELAGRFIEQAKHLKIEVIPERVNRLSYQDKLFVVETDRQEYHAGMAVIASGTKPKPLSGCAIDPEIQDRIFYEVFPLLDRKGCQIAIIGAGDAAFDYALNLAGENEVIILSRGEAASCLPLLRERAAACPGILYHPSTRISRLEPSETGKVRVTGVQAHQEFDIQVDMVLCATGREAQLDFMPAMAQGEVERLEKDGSLYFIGDVKNGLYRQAAIAVGDGIYAGMKIFQQLKETEL